MISSIFEVAVALERELPGSFIFKELGATKEEVNMKKISNRNMMSVSAEVLNSALTLLLLLSAMLVLSFEF